VNAVDEETKKEEVPENEVLIEEAAVENKQRMASLKDIREAKSKYDRDFFRRFAYKGSFTMPQKALEQHVQTMSKEEIAELTLSIVNSAYEVNDLIPNIELVLFKMFTSPMTTKEQRRGAKDLLEGNLFRGVTLDPTVYESLLESIAMNPKKKHFKKIIQHIEEQCDNLPKEQLSRQMPGDLIDMIVTIGIHEKYPVYMGTTLKNWLARGYDVQPRSFKDYFMFLERCKGFEEDAKRYVTLAHDTDHIQVDYAMLRGIFLRSIQSKTGPEVLKLFEQFRKTIKLNKAG